MDTPELLLAEDVVTEFTNCKNIFLQTTVQIGNKQIELYQNTILNYQTNFIANATSLIENFALIQEFALQQNKTSSCDFNVFRIFHPSETIHSYLLANLLNPNAEHGQKNLFLNIFLDMLGIKRYGDNENWIVTAEKGRIDILLKRVHPHAVLVIENKSNYATDQDHQLYRYWYQEIYKTICETSIREEYILNPPENRYQIIYLTPEHWKIPSNNSLAKPPDYPDGLPSCVPLKTKSLLFKNFVVKWLTQSLEELPKDNHRIKQYVKQYIEFWT